MHLIIIPRPFEEKRGDIVFDIPPFRPSFRPLLRSRYLVYVSPQGLQFFPIPVKLYMCLGHGLMMCILFGHNLQIIFCHFDRKKNLVIFAVKVNRYYAPCICISSYSFSLSLLKFYRCLGHCWKMCLLFRHNPRIFCSLFH